MMNAVFWNTYGECENYTIFTGHTGVVLELQYSPEGDRVYTCSSDKSIQVWDLKAGGRIKKLNGHTSVVNSCDVSRSQATFLCR